MLTPFYEEDNITIYNNDIRDILPKLPKVAMVLADPPYDVDSNVGDWDKDPPYQIIPKLIDLSMGPVLWFGASSTVLRDIKRFDIEPHRILIWNVTFILGGAAAHGIYYRWHPIYTWQLDKRPKTRPSHPSMDVLTEPNKYNPINDIIMIAQDGHNKWFHKGTKPVKLFRELIQLVPEDSLILDPFLGSGTTAVACKELHRKCIGVEIVKNYCDIAVMRLATTNRMTKKDAMLKMGLTLATD